MTVSSHGAALLAARDAALAEAVGSGLAAAIVSKDATTWGAEATAEASVRLGWLDCAQSSRSLLPQITALRERLRAAGVDRVVLAGMGGSSLAPEVITKTYGVPLTVLDTTDPGQVAAALVDLDRTVVVVSSKSGGTIETDSHRRAFEQAFRDAGIDPAERLVIVTDPGSPLEQTARDASYQVFLADPNVGGRYSALTAFGLVPAGLAGAPVGELLDQAAAVLPSLVLDEANPALDLGAALGGFGNAGHDKVVLAGGDSSRAEGRTLRGFGDWAEQLIAESTGKHGRGLLPVVVEGVDAPGFTDTSDTHLVVLGAEPPAGQFTGTTVNGPLGAQFLAWEFATAVAGKALQINPFDQPNVQESKDNTNAVLDQAFGGGSSGGAGRLPASEPLFVDGAVEVHTADAGLLDGAQQLAPVLTALLRAVPGRGYLAVMAYLDRLHDAAAAELRARLARRLPHPVTFGWAPRFLHSTGQFHKGGPQVGVFLQVTGAHTRDLDVPGRPYTFGQLQQAQALGDLQALESRGRPVVRLHLTDRAAGLRQLLDAANGDVV
ncbi:MAG TPA: glucose-6-phosphate isomerase [Mycobacteriales bacterium]|nr:glucose-6-phosphate isomerase [Mycobacteriales bacterium]